MEEIMIRNLEQTEEEVYATIQDVSHKISKGLRDVVADTSDKLKQLSLNETKHRTEIMGK